MVIMMMMIPVMAYYCGTMDKRTEHSKYMHSILHGRKSSRHISSLEGYEAMGTLGERSNKWEIKKDNMKVTCFSIKKTVIPLINLSIEVFLFLFLFFLAQ